MFLSPEVLQAVFLGIVQGIAEFLPVSSSGHLVIATKLFGIGSDADNNLTLNVALHVGTLLSICVVYRRDLWALLQQFRLCLLIVLATVPIGLVGLAFEPLLEKTFNTPLVVGFGWLATGSLLLLSQRVARKQDAISLQTISSRQALQVGLFQAIALVPGISRSGSTIAGGLFGGLQRDAAVTFSFFIAIPAISAAALHTAMSESQNIFADPDAIVPLVVGAVTSFVVGVFSLKFLLKIVSRGKLHWFAYYCLAMSICTIFWQLFMSAGATLQR